MNDSNRNENDIRVINILQAWRSALPAIKYAYDNMLYSAIRTRASGGTYGAKHALDNDYDTLMESFRKKIDDVESELESSLVKIREFRQKYLD